MTFRLAHVSDLHLTGARDEAAQLDTLFGAMRAYDVDHVLVTGDVTESGEAAGFKLFDRVRRKHGYGPRRSTVLPGNHDLPGWSTFSRLFGAEFQAEHRSLAGGRVHVVTSNSAQFDDRIGLRSRRFEFSDLVEPERTGAVGRAIHNPRGWIDAAELDALDATLAKLARRGGTIVAAVHHHVFDPPAADAEWWMHLGRPLSLWGPLENRADYLVRLARHGVRFVLTGHSHTHRARRLPGGIRAMISGSTLDSAGCTVLDFHESGRVEEGWIEFCCICHDTDAVECDECEGDGQVTCDACDDDCAVACGSCNWLTRRACDDCEGSGRVACGDCGGDGAVECPDCEGSGETACGAC